MALYYDRGKELWRYEFQHLGERHTGSAKTKAEARTEREEHRKRVKAEAKNQTQTDTAFSTVANQYLDWSTKRHVKGTVDVKKIIYRRFIAHAGDLDIREITPAVLHAFLSTRPNNHSYNTYRKDLCALFSFAIKQLRLMEHSPCWSLERMPEETKRKEIPTQEEFLRILAAAGPDEKPLLIILAHTLGRIDEILRMTWQDVNFDRLTVTLWTRKRKGGNLEPRTIPMNEDLHKTLWQMWRRREQQTWVFYNKREDDRYLRRPKLMRTLCRRAGVKHYGFHAIRHFVATYLHDIKKIPTGVIGGILGHQSKRTTEVYLHSVDESAREAMRRLEGAFEGESLVNPHTPTTHQIKRGNEKSS
jgi:integrase